MFHMQICARCARRLLTGRQVRRALAVPDVGSDGHQTRSFATVQDSAGTRAAGDLLPGDPATRRPRLLSSRAPGIRDRLRDWKPPAEVPSRPDQADELGAPIGPVSVSEKPEQFKSKIEHDEAAFDDSGPLREGDEAVASSSGVALQPGELCHNRMDEGTRPVLSIYLGQMNGRSIFITDSGRWFSGVGTWSLFSVKGFGELEEVTPVLAALPSEGDVDIAPNTMQEFGEGAVHEVGQPLIQKMRAFRTESDRIQQMFAPELDNIRSLLKESEQVLTLAEITSMLLPPKMMKDGAFPPVALFTVQLALLRDDVAFRPVSRNNHAPLYLWRTSPATDVQLHDHVEAMTREFAEKRQAGLDGWPVEGKLTNSHFGRFILKARKAIDDSRRMREWSPTGMLGPTREGSKGLSDAGWTEHDNHFIRFLFQWAVAPRLYTGSHQHCSGAVILKALDRYGDAFLLDRAVAWTFLREIGALMPWELTAPYQLRLPGVEARSNLARDTEPRAQSHGAGQPVLAPDIFEGMRKDWAGVPAFCIDSANTEIIDDGISLEAADESGTYWIHVHVADPASRISHDSELAAKAAQLVSSCYLPGYFEHMLASAEVRESFSLAPDRPSLTFSTKVNGEGLTLDCKITPGYLREVIYMDSQHVNAMTEPWRKVPDLDGLTTFSTEPKEEGGGHKAAIANRHLTRPEELSAQQAEALQTLNRLAKALHHKRARKGAMLDPVPNPAAKVSFNNVTIAERGPHCATVYGDARIDINYGDQQSHSALVEELMLLAGESAGKWCRERGLPMPYRSQPVAAQNLAALRAYYRDVVNPHIAATQSFTWEQLSVMRALMGVSRCSTVPGPFVQPGLDQYIKVTSPLRRYADLLAHWQIEAALLEEARRGGAATLAEDNAHDDGSFLLFSRAALDDSVLPMLELREQLVRARDGRQGQREWMVRALAQAWAFGERGDGSPQLLPPTFRFTVANRAAATLLGRLDWFNVSARLDLNGLGALADNGQGTRPPRMADVRDGDVFEVVLRDIRVYNSVVYVDAVRRL